MSYRNRSRRGNSLRPINRIKHVIDNQQGIVLGNGSNVDLIQASDTPDLATTNEVQTGSTVNGIYLKVELYATTNGALANFYMIVYKNPGGNLADITPNAVGIKDDKRYVIHQEMIMLEQKVNGNPRTAFNGVIVLPRGYRRFGPNDNLRLRMFAPGVDVFVCIQCHYKEFR